MTQVQFATHAAVGAFVDELARCGIHHACVCPGSRSTPLAMLLADHPAFKVWMHLDERSAAFFALGFAKAQRLPVVLVCTSGTAAANFMPAVVEAHYARVPLIVLTADRPPELRDIGAPQAIDQLRLYGSHAKWFVEMALPEAAPEALCYVRTVASRAVSESLADPAGPVHLNFPFREPLVPLPADPPIADAARPDNRPYADVKPGLRRADPSTVRALAADLSSIERGLIVCGPQTDPAFPAAVARLAAALGYPILADPLSQVRCGPHARQNVISAYDAFLRDAGLADRAAPQVILRFGASPTSKPLVQYMQQYAGVRQVLVDSSGWNDPTLLVSDVIHADAARFCEDLSGYLNGHNPDSGQPWLSMWIETDRRARSAITEQLASFDDLFEGTVFTELAALLPDGAALHASSSMPVRDMDSFFPGSDRSIHFLSNRGANGIDGVISSALGAGAANGESGGPLALVIGDLAFYHDMNGLMAAKLHHLNATIVLINNNGGGIFSFLPQAAYPDHFEQLFGTPHGLDFRLAAELYGAQYTCAADWDSFRRAVSQGLASGGLNIVEVQTDRERNVRQHRAVWQAVASVLRVVAGGTA
jgi:2-succinyl-5-enolpyruvyl-6-hydroxy-3-cyclohexene-1-carboxylate synthase